MYISIFKCSLSQSVLYLKIIGINHVPFSFNYNQNRPEPRFAHCPGLSKFLTPFTFWKVQILTMQNAKTVIFYFSKIKKMILYSRSSQVYQDHHLLSGL